MKKALFLFTVLAMPFIVAAQPEGTALELDSEWRDNTLVITAKVYIPGVYTVYMNFNDPTNVSVNSYEIRSVYASGEIMRLKAIDPEKTANANYTYFYVPGIVGSYRTDSMFVYALPFSRFKDGVMVSYARNADEVLKKVRTPDWVSVAFSLQRGDTVFAARKGTVVKAYDQYQQQFIHPARINTIEVQHADNTFAHYAGIEYNGALVSVGDVVYPGTPLAFAGAIVDDRYVSFLNVSNLILNKSKSDDFSAIFDNIHFNPIFATTEGNRKVENNKRQRAVLSDGIITLEMNAREKKKYAAEGLPRIIPPKAAAETAARLAVPLPVVPSPQGEPPRTAEPTAPAAKPAPSAAPASASGTGNLASGAASAGTKGFAFSYSTTPEGAYRINAKQISAGMWSALLTFRDVDNYDIPQYFVDTVSTSRRIFYAAPTDRTRKGNVRFTTRQIAGNVAALPDTTYKYRMPFADGQAHKYTVSPPGVKYTQLRLFSVQGETIHAMREGIVVTVAPKKQEDPAAVPETAYIIVQHPDGSLCQYGSGVKLSDFSPGDKVAEGQPLGTAKGTYIQIMMHYAVFSDGNFAYRSFVPMFSVAK